MKRKLRILVVALCLAMLMAGCGAGKGIMETVGSTYDMAASVPQPAANEAMPMERDMKEEEVYDEEGLTSTGGIDQVKGGGQKLIKTVRMSVETKEFDTLLEDLRRQVEELGGYIESSEISGSSYYSSSRNRYAWLTLRIPADRLDGFVTIVGELGNVTNKSESVEDITLQYVDVESHKKALLTEQERLMTFLEQAESMEDIIAIESRLSQVRYELQSYESTLRTYDNQVTYSTVSLDISEVERETKVVEKKTFFEEIRYRLSDNLYDIGQDARNFAIWFISSLPYLVIWALLIALVVILSKKWFKKRPRIGRKKKLSGEKQLENPKEVLKENAKEKPENHLEEDR